MTAAQRELNAERQRVATLQAERDASAAALQAAQAETDRDVAQFTPNGGDAQMAENEGDDAGPAPDDELNPAQMTVQEIKEWLTDHEHEADVWELNGRKPRAKKSDWVDLMQSKR